MRKTGTGLFALLVVGGIFAWRNRFQIQEFLEARGINLPLDTESVNDRVQSGVARIKGKFRHSVDRIRPARSAI